MSANFQLTNAVVIQAAEVQVIAHRFDWSDHAQMGAAGVMQAADDFTLLVEGNGKAIWHRFWPESARQFGQLCFGPRWAVQHVGIGFARWGQGDPERAVAVTLQVVRQARQVVDENIIVADLDGQLVENNNKIIVDPTIEIKGDVDLSTGNIDFNGSVLIKGSVQAGFAVRADGDVEIRGTISGGNVEAKNIIVFGGILDSTLPE